ncbi:MAG: hypothetical protein CMP76_12225 [Flavobacterium sp.]|uniref:hypothetical protein n=1 Tax=Flavobacterium sp. TaxID=239 RepID=UPI000C4A1E58|nr:hypothetical protein [Flavobacterium sp.]MBF04052.1 hypothetical protein [Flavobacterium sp.]|tara:strand:+ start:3274 stop:4122 length:849 start_codon:yes stop_codon:yes gene_type:complete
MQKITLNKGERKQFEVTGESISALIFTFVTSSNAFKTQLHEIKFSISLRKGKEEIHKLFTGDLNDHFLNQVATNSSYADEIKSAALGAYVFPYTFGTVLNLKDDLSLYLELENKSTVTETVEMTVSTHEDMGVTTHIPIVRKIYLESDKKDFTYPIGNFVKSVNVHAGGINAFNITQLLIESDKIKCEYDKTSFFLQGFVRVKGNYSVDYIEPYTLFQFPQLVNELKLKFTTDIPQSGRVMYVTHYVMTEKIVQNFIKKTEMHNQVNTAVITDSKEITCGCK